MLFNLPQPHKYKYYHAYSVVEETEAQRGEGTNLGSHSQEVLVPHSKSHTLSAPFLGAGYWVCSSALLSGICRD